jgi:hypothetical protein
MSAHNPCTCKGTRKERMKNWRVLMRNYNLSHFSYPKGGRTASDYSSVICLNCKMNIRSKAGYVKSLPDVQIEVRFDVS